MLVARSFTVATLALALVAAPVLAQEVAWGDPWAVTVAGAPDASADPWASFDPSPSPGPVASVDPSAVPSAAPSVAPTPSPGPTERPGPSDAPATVEPTVEPTIEPGAGPTDRPDPDPTARPTPTPEPTLEVAFPLPTTPPVAPVDAPPRPDVVLIVLDDLPAMDARVWSRLPSVRALFLERGLVGSIAAAGGRSAVLTGREAAVEATPSPGPTATESPRERTAKAKAKAKAKAARAKADRRPRAPASPAPKARKGAKRHASPAAETPRPRVAETLATALSRAGYATAFAGESPRRDGASLAGFDHTLVLGPGYLDVSVTRDGAEAGTAATSTGELGRGAAALIASAPDDRPLFLAVAPFAPHVRTGGRGRPLPWAPDSAIADPRCGGIADWPLGAADPVALAGPEVPLAPLCASLLPVDGLLTRIAVALAEAGRTDVLFILTSDDGMAAGVYGVPPKGSTGASRLPLMLAWPSALGGEPITGSIEAAQPDIAATVCDLAGCRFPKRLAPFPGSSFARALLDER